MRYKASMRYIHLTSLIIMCGLLLQLFIRIDMSLHKSFGLLIMIITTIRFINIQRYKGKDEKKDKLNKTSKAVFWLFYILIIMQCILGLIGSYLKGYPTKFFKLFTIEGKLEPIKNIGSLLHDMHEILAIGLIALIIIHLAVIIIRTRLNKKDYLKRLV